MQYLSIMICLRVEWWNQACIGLQRIAECFGSDALTDRGELNRAWMAEHVFSGSDAERKRKMLDGIEHPLIYELAVQLEHEAVEADCQAVVCMTYRYSPK